MHFIYILSKFMQCCIVKRFCLFLFFFYFAVDKKLLTSFNKEDMFFGNFCPFVCLSVCKVTPKVMGAGADSAFK